MQSQLLQIHLTTKIMKIHKINYSMTHYYLKPKINN